MKSPVTNETTPASRESPYAPRLRDLRAQMRQRGLDALLVRATDRYLNEYVPVERSTRAFLTGFRGSMGDALVTLERGLLFIDGRYTLQAATEAPDFEAVQVALGQPIEEGWLAALEELAQQGVRCIGIESDRVPVATFAQLEQRASSLGLSLVPTVPSLVEQMLLKREGEAPTAASKIWPIAPSISGRTVKERLTEVGPGFAAAGLDGFVVIPLDEIAWLTNLRGDAFPYQATFPARALALGDEVLLAAAASQLSAQPEEAVRFVAEKQFEEAVAALVEERGSLCLGYSAAHTPAAVLESLARAGARLVEAESPFSSLRTHKTEAELRHMAHAFARADDVVQRLQQWLHHEVTRGAQVTEADVADKVKALFLESGAWGLSFKVIPAAGVHGAVIHYSSPDDATPLAAGDMFLLDTGGYYEGGYATDLTRTFLVGGPEIPATSEQKRLFTLVLKGAIAGMSARFPRGTRGEQLDALVRAPLWAAGLNYAHGTGHGVGVNVHEFPPRLMPGNRHFVEPGYVFSVEPGVYLPGFGGVRIENLVTCVEDPDAAGFFRIRPLTFSPFDERLIDDALLTSHERAFLRWFAEGAARPHEERLTMPLPPLP